MKKIFAAVAALVLGAGSTFALDLAPGIRGNLALNVGSTSGDESFGGDDLDSKLLVGGGFALYANLGFADVNNWTFGFQPELGFQFNNGYKGESSTSVSGYTVDMAYSATGASFEFPVLFTARYNVNDKFFVGAGIGPYFSIPLGKIKMKLEADVSADSDSSRAAWSNSGYGSTSTTTYTVTTTSSSEEDDESLVDVDEKYSASGLNTGIVFDLNGGMALGPGALVLDLRYLLDFGSTKVKIDGSSYKVFTRRALTFGVGYQLKFSF